MTSEEQARQRRIILSIVGAAAILIAAVIGLTIGKGASPDAPDTSLTAKENFVSARTATLADVKKESAREGYRAGRKSGAKQGVRAGRRAGQSDGAIRAQLEITSAAQSAAASAQSELDGISTPPPDPTASPPGTTPPGE